MVFGLFSRKSTQDDPASEHHARLPTPTPSIAHHSPLRFSTTFRSVLGGSYTTEPKDFDLADNDQSSALPPPETPSPPPLESKALYDLMLSVPPKTLHAYTLAHLHPRSPPPPASTSSPALASHSDGPRPPSPNTVTNLAAFFSTLAPPPLLHCVRCHKDFYEIENEEKDKACRVAHDDESALVSRVSGGGGYETLWGCCGQTASGDGSEGPPDGWCYEGRHTTDIKRARFRADSTIHDDKLTSCLRLNCHGIRDRLPRRDSPQSHTVGASSARRSNASPVRSQASRSTRKRPRMSLKEASGSEKEGDAESSTGRAAKPNPKESLDGDAGDGDKDASMAVDAPNPPSKPKSKAKSRPISKARPSASTSTVASLPAAGATAKPISSKAKSATTKPKSTRTLLSQSHTRLASDSEAPTQSRPRTRSLVREESHGKGASRSRAPSKRTKADVSERTRPGRAAKQSPGSEEGPEAETDNYRESEQEGRGRDRKKRRLGRD